MKGIYKSNPEDRQSLFEIFKTEPKLEIELDPSTFVCPDTGKEYEGYGAKINGSKTFFTTKLMNLMLDKHLISRVDEWG